MIKSDSLIYNYELKYLEDILNTIIPTVGEIPFEPSQDYILIYWMDKTLEWLRQEDHATIHFARVSIMRNYSLTLALLLVRKGKYVEIREGVAYHYTGTNYFCYDKESIDLTSEDNLRRIIEDVMNGVFTIAGYIQQHEQKEMPVGDKTFGINGKTIIMPVYNKDNLT